MAASALRDRAIIAGIGETAYTRNSGKSAQQLTFEACDIAIRDAGLTPKDIDGIVLPNASHGVQHHEFEHTFGGNIRYAVSSPGHAGAGVGHAILLAAQAIEAGHAENVVVWLSCTLGSSKASPGAVHDADLMKHQFETPYGFYGQPSMFSLIARRHMHEFGTKEEHLGAIAVASRKHAILNGNAVMRQPLTMADYMNSRGISEPFRVLDCCLMNDGGAAFVVTSADKARDIPNKPVYVAGAAYDVGNRSAFFAQGPMIHTQAVATAPAAYAMAGLGPDDVDVAMMYDCFSYVVLTEIEDHGFCAKGEGGSFVENGNIELGGTLPVNTHGGNLSQSYLMGVNHVCEGVRQLRGTAGAAQVEDAKVALYGGFGGWDYASVVLRGN